MQEINPFSLSIDGGDKLRGCGPTFCTLQFCSSLISRIQAMTDGHLFNNISLGGRGGSNPGQLTIYSGGILWKKQGGGNAVEVEKSDIVAVTWMEVPRTNELGIQSKDGLFYKFIGFHDQGICLLF